jgi:hypothetical protein
MVNSSSGPIIASGDLELEVLLCSLQAVLQYYM